MPVAHSLGGDVGLAADAPAMPAAVTTMAAPAVTANPARLTVTLTPVPGLSDRLFCRRRRGFRTQVTVSSHLRAGSCGNAVGLVSFSFCRSTFCCAAAWKRCARSIGPDVLRAIRRRLVVLDAHPGHAPDRAQPGGCRGPAANGA